MNSTKGLEADIHPVEMIIDHNFSDKTWLSEALQLQAAGSGLTRAGDRAVRDGNKRLALVGDTLLKLIVVLDGYNEGASREIINNAIQVKTNNNTLARVCKEVTLDKHIVSNPSQRGIVSAGIMANTVEAILGAVYLDSDGNTKAVKHVMEMLDLAWT